MRTIEKKKESPAGERGDGRRFLTPRTDIFETEDAYVLTADMPGVAKDGLEISIDQDELVIVGRRSVEDVAKALYRESHGYDYRRVFSLEALIDRDKVKAQLENGVLRLELPKAEAHKPRKILVS